MCYISACMLQYLSFKFVYSNSNLEYYFELAFIFEKIKLLIILFYVAVDRSTVKL